MSLTESFTQRIHFIFLLPVHTALSVTLETRAIVINNLDGARNFRYNGNYLAA